MPIYSFLCIRGHETERFYHMNDKRPARVRCSAPACRHYAKRAITRPQVVADIQEHFNVSMDEPVRSRRHMKELMQVHDCRPYEPVRDQDDIRHAAWKAEQTRESDQKVANEGWGDMDLKGFE